MATPSRDEMVDQLRVVATKLGKTSVSRAEFLRETGVTERGVMKHFDSWTQLVEAANLEPARNRRLSEDEMFAALRDAYIEAGGMVPTQRLRKHCRISESVYTNRFGRWQNVLAHFRAWLVEHDPAFPYMDALPIDASALPITQTPKVATSVPSTRTRYGAFLNFRGLQHEPINEQGVVYLFGIVAFELGYVVEGVGTGFPDCEAKRSISTKGDAWERVRIEFEFRSRNFLDHGHRAEDCDVIVCWKHNWPDCPVEVLELRSAIASLGD